jgi:hypothetical protein
MGLEKNIWELLKEVKKGNEESAVLDQSISATSTRMNNMRHDILRKEIAVDFQNIGNFFLQAATQKIDTVVELPVVRDEENGRFFNVRLSTYNGGFFVSAHTNEGTDNIYRYDQKEGGHFSDFVGNGLANDDYYKVLAEVVDDWGNIHKQIENEMTSRLNARIQELSVGIPEKNSELKVLQAKEATIKKKHEALELG